MLCVLWVAVARGYSTFAAGTAIATRGSCVWLLVSQAGRISLVQALVAAEHNLLQISYACTSPLLSDRFRFPTVRSLFRTTLSGAECSVTCVLLAAKTDFVLLCHTQYSKYVCIAVCTHRLYFEEPCTCDRLVSSELQLGALSRVVFLRRHV